MYIFNFQTLFSKVVKNVKGPHAANFAMLLMWASLANAIPVSINLLLVILLLLYLLLLLPLTMLADNINIIDKCLVVPGAHFKILQRN